MDEMEKDDTGIILTDKADNFNSRAKMKEVVTEHSSSRHKVSEFTEEKNITKEKGKDSNSVKNYDEITSGSANVKDRNNSIERKNQLDLSNQKSGNESSKLKTSATAIKVAN